MRVRLKGKPPCPLYFPRGPCPFLPPASTLLTTSRMSLCLPLNSNGNYNLIQGMKKDLGEDTVCFLAVYSLSSCRHLSQLQGKFLSLQALNQLQPVFSIIRTHSILPLLLCVNIFCKDWDTFRTLTQHIINLQCIDMNIYVALEAFLISKAPWYWNAGISKG